jgi:hypothetical protein
MNMAFRQARPQDFDYCEALCCVSARLRQLKRSQWNIEHANNP